MTKINYYSFGLQAEANLNAQTVRKCVWENEKGAEQYRKLCDECTRLERECALYLHDREVFMEAADEAEERANEAEERVLQAENKIQELLSQVQHLKQGMSHSTVSFFTILCFNSTLFSLFARKQITGFYSFP
jgi:hypothetical protein